LQNRNKKILKKSRNTQSTHPETLEIQEEKDNLTQQATDLQNKAQRLKIERDIYKKAAEIIKKD
jgi:hypothetical protein